MLAPDDEPKFQYDSKIEYNTARGCWDLRLSLSGFRERAEAEELEKGIRSGFTDEGVFEEALTKNQRH